MKQGNALECYAQILKFEEESQRQIIGNPAMN